jgi:hypothetical protein
MLEPEREKIMSELSQLWPKKFTDDELIKFVHYVRDYAEKDVIEALDSHKKTKPFPPRVNEILAVLKGKETREAKATIPRRETFSDILAANLKCGPHEAVLRHYRGDWFEHVKRANQRLSGISPAMAEPLRAEEEKLLGGVKRGLACRCEGALVAAEMSYADAERYARCIFAEPDEFRMVLDDIRLNGVSTVAPVQVEPDSLIAAFEPMGFTPAEEAIW